MTIFNISFYIRKRNLMLVGFDIEWRVGAEDDAKTCITGWGYDGFTSGGFECGTDPKRCVRKYMQSVGCSWNDGTWRCNNDIWVTAWLNLVEILEKFFNHFIQSFVISFQNSITNIRIWSRDWDVSHEESHDSKVLPWHHLLTSTENFFIHEWKTKSHENYMKIY